MRLKRAAFRDRSEKVPEFQYQKGAIKTRRRGDLQALGKGFQYQKGAIKTLAATLKGGDSNAFQYQKGAIKTVPGQPQAPVHGRSFNTKKVRLKHLPVISREFTGHVSIPKRCD